MIGAESSVCFLHKHTSSHEFEMRNQSQENSPCNNLHPPIPSLRSILNFE